jgi:hypothetical protein
MAILDVWNNPLGTSVASVIGYRGEFEQFPHDLYSFLLSTVREADQNDIALLYRWMRPMQQFWEQQYSAILTLPNLYSPENCAVELLDYLRKNIGILDDLSYIWGVMSETEKRRFIKYFVRFLTYRGTSYGMLEMFETMTGYPSVIRGYFFYRWILSGDSELYMYTALGREDAPGDTWLLSEYETPIGEEPDDITIPGGNYYLFEITTLVGLVTNPPIPLRVFVRCRLTGETRIGYWYQSGSQYYIRFEDNYYFNQSPSSASTTESDFQVGFEIDQYVSDVLVVDDGTINREMLKGLARFSRPLSERIYLRYYNLIEDFRSIDRWERSSLTYVTHDRDNETVLIDGTSSAQTLQLDYLDSANWTDYGLTVKCQQPNENDTEIRFMYQDSDNYYYLKLQPKTPPTWPPWGWVIGRYVGGVHTALSSGLEDTSFDFGVDHVWRIECFTSARPGGDVQIIRAYQDENLFVDYVDDPVPWTSAYGTIELYTKVGAQLLVTTVHCHPIPMEYDYIAPTV